MGVGLQETPSKVAKGTKAFLMDLLLRPSAGYGRITEFTAPIVQVELIQLISISLYEYLAALMAVGMASLMPGNISQIDIMDSFLQSQISKLLQGFYGGRWQPGQFVLREKSQEVERIIRSQIL